jgi:Leucine-rich repeat (LRR) protein
MGGVKPVPIKLIHVVAALLGSAGIVVLAYVLTMPQQTPGSSADSASATAVGIPKPPMVRPPVTVKALEISSEKGNEELINEIGNYPNLKTLSIQCLDLAALPDAIGKLTALEELDMDEGNGCSMNPILPESIGNLQSLKKLNLDGAQDPREIGEISSSKHHRFPAGMARLKNLTYLNLGRNGMSEIPPFVGNLTKLTELDFSWNMEVKEIPTFVTNLRQLTTLRLNADDLTDLPDFLNKLPNLRKISLGNNCDITQNPARKADLQRRFPKVKFDFDDEYDCPETLPANASPPK